MNKELLKKAYEAGKRSVQLNKERDELIERGTMQCPAEYNFENWLKMQEITDKKSPSWKEYSDLANEVCNQYSEVKKLNSRTIGAAQLHHAMEKFHKKAKQLEDE